MAALEEIENYDEEIYQLEVTDAVIGGASGLSNIQPKQLANRTNWLKAAIEKIIDGTTTVAKAAKLAVARKITINGVVNGSADFDGSSNITINVSLVNGQITINSIDGLSTALNGKQDSDATLSALAQLSTVANKMIYTTASDTFATADLTAFARTLLDDADAAAARATLGAAPTASPTFTGTVTAPTFSGALSGNATTATTASYANSAGNGVAYASCGPNGYIKFNNEIIIQWGRWVGGTIATNGGALDITFPITFPNDCGAANVQIVATTPSNGSTQIEAVATSTSNLHVVNKDVDSAVTQIRWFAIGW